MKRIKTLKLLLDYFASNKVDIELIIQAFFIMRISVRMVVII